MTVVGVVLDAEGAPYREDFALSQAVNERFGRSVVETSASVRRAMVQVVQAADEQKRAFAEQRLVTVQAAAQLDAYAKSQDRAAASASRAAAAVVRQATEQKAANAGLLGSLVGAAGGGRTAAELAKVTAGAGSAGAALHGMGTVGALALAGIGYESAKAAVTFEQTTTRLQTQAHVTAGQMQQMSDGVRQLVSQTATGPNQLAEAIYHVASAGYAGRDALLTMKQAALGAKVGNADLDATTNTLVGTMKALDAPGRDATSVMAQLNAIVGAGKMTMDQLNSSLATGIIPTARTFGVSLSSVGAALAYMTDRGTPADQAATRLRMSLTLLADPAVKASKALAAIGMQGPDVKAATQTMADALHKAGLTTTTMAADLRKPDGIQVALQDLKTHLTAAGFAADASTALMAKAFGGGRTDAAILELINNTDGLRQKFDQVTAGASRFGDDVARTQHTAAYQMALVRSQVENLGLTLGQRLLPVVKDVIDWTEKHKQVLKDVAEIAGVLMVAKLTTMAAATVMNTTIAGRAWMALGSAATTAEGEAAMAAAGMSAAALAAIPGVVALTGAVVLLNQQWALDAQYAAQKQSARDAIDAAGANGPLAHHQAAAQQAWATWTEHHPDAARLIESGAQPASQYQVMQFKSGLPLYQDFKSSTQALHAYNQDPRRRAGIAGLAAARSIGATAAQGLVPGLSRDPGNPFDPANDPTGGYSPTPDAHKHHKGHRPAPLSRLAGLQGREAQLAVQLREAAAASPAASLAAAQAELEHDKALVRSSASLEKQAERLLKTAHNAKEQHAALIELTKVQNQHTAAVAQAARAQQTLLDLQHAQLLAATDLANAKLEAGINFADPLSALKAKILEDQNTLATDTPDTAQYYRDLTSLHQAQWALIDATQRQQAASVQAAAALVSVATASTSVENTVPGYVALRAAADKQSYLPGTPPGSGGQVFRPRETSTAAQSVSITVQVQGSLVGSTPKEIVDELRPHVLTALTAYQRDNGLPTSFSRV